MSSGSFNSNVVSNYFYGQIRWSYTQNVNEGTTTIKADLYLATQANQMRSFNSFTTLVALNINGNVNSSGYVFNGINYNPGRATAHVQHIRSHTYTVRHNADGGPTKVNISGEVVVDSAAVNMGYAPSRILFGKDIAIPVINRKATMTQPSNGQVGVTSTFTFNRPNANTEVMLQWRNPGGQWNTILNWSKTNSVNYTWPESAVPNRARSLSDTVELSYSSRINGTSLGGGSYNIAVSVRPNAPVAAISRISDRSEYASVLNSAAYIRHVSTIQLQVSGNAYQGATISQYIVEYNGSSSSHTTGTISLPAPSASGTVPIRVKVRDSRGNESAWVSQNITVLDYAPPSLGGSKVYRTGSSDTNIGVALNQIVSPVNWNGSNRNQYTIRARVRTNGGSFGNFINLYTNKKDNWNNPLSIAIPNQTVPQSSSAEVEIGIKDNFSREVTIIVPLTGASVVLSYNRDGVGVGTVRPTTGKTLVVGGSGVDSPAYYIGGKKLDFDIETSGRLKVATAQGISSPKYFIGNDELKLWVKPTGYTHGAAANSNLDNHRTPGVWMVNNPTVGPSVTGTNQFYVFNVFENDSYGVQLAIQKNSGALYSRSRHNNVWQPWVEHKGTSSIQSVVNSTLTKSWVTNNRIQYKEFGDMIAIRCTYSHTGATLRNNASVVLGTLPAAFRPSDNRALTLIPNTNGAHTRMLQLDKDGTLRLFHCDKGSIYHIDVTYIK